MTRIALGVEYDGSNYQGFQKQFEVNSIQQCLEEAVGRIANHKVDIFCAGRTDAGVNATQQVIHFDYLGDKPRDVSSWMRGCNVFLPPDISIKWAKEVPDDFHARFSAFERTYRYIILNSHSRPAILNGGISFYPGRRLDENLMHEAGQYLLGENDFSSFRASECQSKTPFRNVHSLSVTRDRDYIIVEISANAFLHHMVRNIVGDLLEEAKMPSRTVYTWLVLHMILNTGFLQEQPVRCGSDRTVNSCVQICILKYSELNVF